MGGTLTLQADLSSTGDRLNCTGTVSGAGGLIKTGAGTAAVTRVNSYAGPTVVQQGTLLVTVNCALGSTSGGACVAAGGTLALQSVGYWAEALALNGSGAGGLGALRNVSGSSSWAGAVTLSNAVLIRVDGSALSLDGGVNGPGSFVKNGNGTLYLTQVGTYAGGTVVSNGALWLDILVLYDVLFIVVAFWVFEYVVEE